MTNAVIKGTVYNTTANPTSSNKSVNTRPAGLADMSMISPNPTVVSVITVIYTASSRPCSVPPITAYPITPMVVDRNQRNDRDRESPPQAVEFPDHMTGQWGSTRHDEMAAHGSNRFFHSAPRKNIQ